MLAKFFDDFAIAGRGLLLATKKKSFWLPFVLTFVIFGMLINLLSSGFISFQLIGGCLSSGDISGALKIVGSAFSAIFGIGRALSDFIFNFILTLLQSVLIALVVFVAKHNRKEKRDKKSDKENESTSKNSLIKSDSPSSLESSALVAGLAVLGSGCPTCGTTLLAPVLGAILSGTTGAVSLAGTLSLILNIIAILIAILVFRKLGVQTYAIIKSEHFKEIHHEKAS